MVEWKGYRSSLKCTFEIKVITLWNCLLGLIKLITVCEEALSYLYIHAHTDVFKQSTDITIKHVWTKYQKDVGDMLVKMAKTRPSKQVEVTMVLFFFVFLFTLLKGT